MLSDEIKDQVLGVTLRTWETLCDDAVFQGMFRGKERGHRVADFVEEKTVDCLEASFDVKHEVAAGNRKARGMGDAWLLSNGIYNPINVKAGVHGIGGQPNMVSLAKLTRALMEHWIDSYYLLLVKFTDATPPSPEVQLVNILDFLEFLHFDSGTGQLLLRADRFSAHIIAGGGGTGFSLGVVVGELVALRREGDARLKATRERNLGQLEERLLAFDPEAGVDQSGLTFG